MAKMYSYTIFIDILGYSNAIKEISNEDEAKDVFDLLSIIEEEIIGYFNRAQASKAYKEYDMHYTFFSDCIILSFVPKNNLNIDEDEMILFNQTTLEFLFTWIINVQFIALLKTEFLLRGGISIKDIFWDEKNKVVGPALIEAYKLESKKASWARIILSEELSQDKMLIDQVNLISKIDQSTYLPHTLLLKNDDEPFYYYNYMGRMLARLNSNNLYGNFDEELLPYITEDMGNDYNQITKNAFEEVVKITDIFIESHVLIIIKNIEHEDNYIREKYINLRKYHNLALKDFIAYNNEFNTLEDLIIK